LEEYIVTNQSHSNAEQDANGVLASLILLGSFVIILGIIMANSRPVPGSSPPTAAAVIAAQETVPPATPEPPTATAVPTSTPLPPTSAVPTTALAAAPASAYDPALVSQGQSLFVLCSACHGPDARGVPNLGKNLVESEFVRSLSDTELANFVKMGRPIWDPANTTGLDMPPKGGNPAMTDEELMAIIAYIRSLQS
jgi:disulfide bond formation protein DsbB